MKIPYKPKTIVAMLVATIILPIFSFFFFYQIENLIHGDLYNYGLIFSPGWADLYSFYAPLYLISLISAWILFGSSIISFFGYDVNKKNRWRFVCILVLALGAILSFLNIYFMFRLNSIVTYDLYLYGLRFSVEWYSNYSLNLNMVYLLAGLEGTFGLAPAILLYGTLRKKRKGSARLFDSIFIAIGTALLALSIIYSSSILALIGLGLLFWGITFTYITTSEYVKKVLLDTTVMAQQATLNRIVQTFEYRGDTIYLPPQFFNVGNMYKAYISKSKLKTLPTAETMPKQKPDLLIDYIDNPQSVLITPPGIELTQLFEKTLEKDFITTSLQDLQRYLPEILIEELEVTSYFDMQIEKDLVRIQIDDSNFRVPNAEIELSSLYLYFDSPLVCAIACVLAKATGMPVIMTKEKTETKGKIITIDYHILDKQQ